MKVHKASKRLKKSAHVAFVLFRQSSCATPAFSKSRISSLGPASILLISSPLVNRPSLKLCQRLKTLSLHSNSCFPTHLSNPSLSAIFSKSLPTCDQQS